MADDETVTSSGLPDEAPTASDSAPSTVPPAGEASPAQPSAEFMAKVDGLLTGSEKLANPASAWVLGQIKTAVAQQQQAQQQIQQLIAAQAQAKTAADVGQGKVAALLPVLERSEAEGS